MTRPLAGPQTLLRALNGRAILEALAHSGPRTRSELMLTTGLSRTAVTQVLRMLQNSGVVAPAGLDRATRGPAAVRIALHPNLGYAAAIHVDHRAAHVAFVDAAGTVHAEAHGEFRSNDERVACIVRLVDECRASAIGPLHLAVIGVPGAVTSDGGIRNDEGPDGGTFRTAMTLGLGCDVRIENDVNLAALAELTDRTAAALSSFALLMMIDEGLGAAIVIDGALHRGASGLAGELMYLPQSPLPIGAPVVSDTVVSDLALANDRDPRAVLRDHLQAAAGGDEGSAQIVDEVAKRLVLIAASVTLVLDPEAFILSGDAAHPVFVDAIMRASEAFSPLIAVRFLVASFGPEAPLAGAVREAAAALRTELFAKALPA